MLNTCMVYVHVMETIKDELVSFAILYNWYNIYGGCGQFHPYIK